MNEPDVKFTKRWNDYLEQYRESAGRIDGERIQFMLQMLRGETNDIMREIDELIRRGQGKE